MSRCSTSNCLNESIKGRTICETCKTRKYRSKHSIKSAYINLRSNAKRRGIEFSLTIDEWIIFCAETNYHKLRGIGGEDMTVDRKKSWLGYSYDNIQMITRKENAKKQHADARDRIKNWKDELKGDPNIPF